MWQKACRAAAVLLVTAGAGACSSDGEPCIVPPCPPPVGAVVTLTAQGASTPPTATILVTGSPGSSPSTITCTGTCGIYAASGSYHLAISAPGYRTIESDFTVKITPAKSCNTCDSADTKSLSFTLVPA